MPCFRKKPVTIFAEQLTDEHVPAGVCFGYPPEVGGTPLNHKHWVQTLEGPMIASNGDWIITGVKGEKYPCRDDIFSLTYEPAPAPMHITRVDQEPARNECTDVRCV